MSACPHPRIQYCPLYVESHNCRGLGCVDDVGKDCKVKRGKMQYQEGIKNLGAVDIKLVKTCRFYEEENNKQEQRNRNLRLNGIH